ncbi:MAG TPA: GNAT family N-acetyltransferase [Acidobacteriota bacterium]|nr:GNAT family N-acetyltransferase [Acidobacteriota bacterium]
MADGTVFVEEVTSLEGVRPHWHAWSQLRDERLEDNIYASPEFLLAGLRSYATKPFTLVFVYRDEAGGKRLIGCAPFETSPSQFRSRLHTATLWSTLHSYLSQPLLHRNHATEAVTALWDWAEGSAPSIDLLALPLMGVDSLTWDAMRRVLEARGVMPLIRRGFLRPMLSRYRSFDEYLASLSAKRRSNYRRQWRNLTHTAEVEVRHHRSLDAGSDWPARFMRMEASGWKGERGSALACCSADAAFFDALSGAYSRRGDLFFTEVRLAGGAIAMCSSFVEGGTLFGFKCAFDPAFGEHSPGMLTNVEEVRQFLDTPELQHADSGANGTSFIGSYWKDRAPVARVLLPSSNTGRLVLAGLNTARRAGRGALLALETVRRARGAA